MKVWEVNYWTSHTLKQGSLKPHVELRYKRFRWKWVAEVYRWWLNWLPVAGMKVRGRIDPVRRITSLGK